MTYRSIFYHQNESLDHHHRLRKYSQNEGHEVAERVRRKLIKVYPNTQDVLIHVDAYDDRKVESIHNISREDVELRATPLLANTNGAFEKTRLRVHHLKGKNFIELYLRGDSKKTIAETEIQLEEIKKHLLRSEHIDGVKIFLEIGDDDHSTK